MIKIEKKFSSGTFFFPPQGFAAHVSPFTEIRDIGGLLSQCGFTMLTIVSVSL